MILSLRKVTSQRMAPAYKLDTYGFIYIYWINCVERNGEWVERNWRCNDTNEVKSTKLDL